MAAESGIQVSAERFSAHPEYYKYLIEARKLDLEEHKQRSDGVPSRRYLPWLTGLLVPIVTGCLTLYGVDMQRQETQRQETAQREETERQRNAAKAETERRAKEETTKRQIENARMALEIYAKNTGLFVEGNADALYHLKMVAIISENEDIKKLFDDMWQRRQQHETEQNPDKSIVDIVKQLPTRLVMQQAVPGGYDYASFLGYVQARTDDRARAEKVATELRAKGMKIQGIDTKIAAAPARNEVRYYRGQHKEFAERMARELGTVAGSPFTAVPIGKGQLPDGVIEIWVGRE